MVDDRRGRDRLSCRATAPTCRRMPQPLPGIGSEGRMRSPDVPTGMGSSVNRVAAGDSGPARCTRASSRTAVCSGRATVAPSCSATMAIDSGIGAAPAPADNRRKMVSRWAVTTASLGFKWTDPRRSSRSHLVEVPSADAMNKSSSKSATVAATAGPPPSRAHGRSLPRDRVRLRPAENFQPVGTGFPNGSSLGPVISSDAPLGCTLPASSWGQPGRVRHHPTGATPASLRRRAASTISETPARSRTPS